jgi:7,8-dihydropterin-6-yl-methyl-4-(beta-D-ribofuranosyl)aminobenzene 5'-phosphate synthase
MKITIVYDNCLSKPGLRTGWGFSSLIEVGGAPPLLFDTGADGAALLYNMKELGINPRQIGTIVISHAHGDHTGGLASVLELNKDAEIYVPASFWGTIPQRKLTIVDTPVQILEAVFSTGELQGIEQSLTVKTAQGIVVVVGCSHPGVGLILDVAAQYGKVYGIIGGLHGFHDFSRLEGLSLICPCHCTQYKSELRRLFPRQYVGCGAGLELEFS